MIIELEGLKIGTSTIDAGDVVIVDSANRYILLSEDELFMLRYLVEVFDSADTVGKLNPKEINHGW